VTLVFCIWNQADANKERRRSLMGKKVLGIMAVLAVCIMVGAQYVQAQSAGETSADWLNIGVGARPTAMGNSYAAIGNDASAIFWNPAGMAAAGKTEFMFQYGLWLAGIQYHAVSLILPFGRGKSETASSASFNPAAGAGASSPYERYSPQYYNQPAAKKTEGIGGGAIGIGLSYLDSGTMGVTTGPSDATEDFSATYYCMMASYAQGLGNALALGVTGKMINETVYGGSASTMAGDAGIVLSAGGKVSVGAVIQNVGSQLNGSNLPQNIRAGVGISGGPLTVGADVVMGSGVSNMCAGVEVNLGGLAIRGGYTDMIDTSGSGALISPGMSVGFGVNTDALCLDLAITDAGDIGAGVGPLNAPLRVSLIFKF
jgi:hypothetical protein